MKVVEKDDSKEKLREKSDAYKAAIEQEVKELGDRTARALVNVAVVAGAVSVAYLVYRGLTSSSRSKSKSRKARRKELVAVEDNGHHVQEESRFASMLSNVGTVLATQATAYLLAFARQKLIEYLKESSEQKEENNQPAN
ncbi:MAG TPA: hypothetical protein VKZ86_15575 [Cyclobacteriaceae bacterium]|nr:hypothetical protein [Cyclobacteriaceae bacterium]